MASSLPCKIFELPTCEFFELLGYCHDKHCPLSHEVPAQPDVATPPAQPKVATLPDVTTLLEALAMPDVTAVDPCEIFLLHCVCPFGVHCPRPHVPPQRPYPESFVLGAQARGDYDLYGIDPPPAPAQPTPCGDCGSWACDICTPSGVVGCEYDDGNRPAPCGDCGSWACSACNPPAPGCECSDTWDCDFCYYTSQPPRPRQRPLRLEPELPWRHASDQA